MPAAAGRTIPVPQGDVSLVVAGSFLEPYQVSIVGTAPAAWITDKDVRQKTATSYRIDFTVPAPADASVDVIEVQSAPFEGV
jgi:hypothetical protein